MSLDSILAQLENEQLIRPVAETDAAYIFKNVLSQQAAYQSLLAKNRRELHRQVAQTFEALYEGRYDEIAALLAQHYGEAGDDLKTFVFCARAGNAAMRVFANAEALGFYSRAVEIARRAPSPRSEDSVVSTGKGDVLREVYLNRGRALEMSGDYNQAVKNYEEMEALGHTRADSAMELDAIIALATIRSTPTIVYDPTLGQSLSDRGIRVARLAGNREAEAKILWNLMNLSFFSMRPQEGIAYGERALAISRELGLTERTAYLLNDINRLYLSMGEVHKARASVSEARELWQGLHNLPMLADNFGSGAELNQYSGELDQAFDDATQAAGLARSISNPWTLSYALGTQASILLERGEMDHAFKVGLESIEAAQQAGFAAGEYMGKAEMAMVYANLGQLDRGINGIEHVLQSMAGLSDMFLPWMQSYAVRLYGRKGRFEDAERTLNQLTASYPPEHPIIFLATPIGIATVELAIAKKEYAGAVRATESLIQKSGKTGTQFMLLDALALQGRAYEGLSQLDSAERVYATARAIAQKTGSRRMLWQILLGLSRVARSRGNAERAEQLRAEARAVVSFISDHLREEEPHTAFLNLPDVREVLG